MYKLYKNRWVFFFENIMYKHCIYITLALPQPCNSPSITPPKFMTSLITIATYISVCITWTY